MAKILQFPVIAENEARLVSRALDVEIAEIHAKVDNEIKERYGSLYMLGISLINRPLNHLTHMGNWS